MTQVDKASRSSAVAASSPAAAKVTDNPARSQFELDTGGEPAIAGYTRKGRVLHFDHTVVPYAMRGKGIAEQLITGALAIVRQRGEKFVAECSYVREFVGKHPEVRDLLA